MSIFKRSDLLIPYQLEHWPIIACDQFTSQPEYWKKVESIVGNNASAYNLVFPENKLGTDNEKIIESINSSMREYLSKGVFKEYANSYVFVERTLQNGKVRHGLVGVIDLEEYDFHAEANTKIRATEEILISRVIPRIQIRSEAVLETSHVLLLANDPENSILGSVVKGELIYDLDLMLGGGHIKGWIVANPDALDAVIEEYVNTHRFSFAVGDGNHSLATAKECWNKYKANNQFEENPNHPSRYAMVELENLFDDSQQFEPIHRIVKGVNVEKLLSMVSGVEWYSNNKCGIIDSKTNELPVANLQRTLEHYVQQYGGNIDYIHGKETAISLAQEKGSVAFILPSIEKNDLFNRIEQEGVLPKKTFSMGNAEEKRYYLECRKIK